MNKLGIVVLGIASAAAGVLDLIWGEFEAAHQPIQAFGDHIPGVEVMAYIAAAWLIAAGVAILWPRTKRFGALALAIIYAVFAVFWFPRFFTAPRVLGYRIGVYIGVSGGVAEQAIIVAAAVIVWASTARRGSSWSRAVLAGRWIVGLCSINFGLAHLTGIPFVARMVPKWMPLGGSFWAVFTGIAFILAGLAVLSRILDVPAARLLGLMLLLFSAIVLLPGIFVLPHNHVAWGANAYNFAAVGAVWIFADAIARRRNSIDQEILVSA